MKKSKSSEYVLYIKSTEWRSKRKEALVYYGKKCCKCNRTHDLHVHHKTYERLGNELMLDLEVLCEECHYKHHGIAYTSVRKQKQKQKRTIDYKLQARRAVETKCWISEIFNEAVSTYNSSGVTGLQARFSKTKTRKLLKSKRFKSAIKTFKGFIQQQPTIT